MNTKSATPPQAEAQDVAAKWPFTDEAIFTAARALAEAIGGGVWETHYTPAQRLVWVARARRALMAADPTGMWRPMSSAPAGDVTACIDIWSGEEDRRYTDCFWGVPGDLPGNAPCWSREETILANDAWVYVTERVPDPVAWMPAPVKPEGL